MPGYGNTGPYRRYRSMGMTLDAVSGHSSLRGYPDSDLSHISLVHHPDAVAAATAVFANLRRAAIPGEDRQGASSSTWPSRRRSCRIWERSSSSTR